MKTQRHPAGSILIWSVMLGFVLTSVFFFMAVRQRSTISVQRDTIEIINEREFIESYASYLQDNPSEKPVIDFDTINGSLTRHVEEITGMLDINETATFNFPGRITVEWNTCDTPARGDMKLNAITYESFESAPCEEFHDLAGPVNVGDPFTLKTVNAPFAYRIRGNDLQDNQWHLTLTSEKSLGKPIIFDTHFTTALDTASAEGDPSLIANEINAEALWILSAARDTGSFTSRPEGTDIVPYYGTHAALALLKLGEASAEAVKSYMEWYFEHILQADDGTDLGAIGVIYDHEVNGGGEEVSIDSYYSASAYAASFLTLARTYLELTEDDTFIRIHLNDLKKIAAAIDATYSSATKLAYATPLKSLAALKDNVDVWMGYRDFAELMKIMNDLGTYRFYRDLALNVRQGIDSTLWDEVNGAYRKDADSADGTITPLDPDADSNLWALAHFLPEAQGRANDLLTDFLAEHEESWKNVNLANPYPWIAVALANAQEFEIVSAYEAQVTDPGKFGNRPEPWNILDSAARISYLLKLLESQGHTYSDYY